MGLIVDKEMMDNKRKDHIVFYWDGSGQVTPQFVSLAQKMKGWGITLVPVSSKELPNLVDGKERVLICVTSSLKQNDDYQLFKHSYLKFAVLNKKIKLVHCSSFGMEDDFRSVLRTGGYSFHPLPLTTTYIAGKAASIYYTEELQEKRWPGGKRARLPDAPEGSH